MVKSSVFSPDSSIEDSFRERVLRAAVLGRNQPPSAARGECAFAAADEGDETRHLWVEGRLAGFATLREIEVQQMRRFL